MRPRAWLLSAMLLLTSSACDGDGDGPDARVPSSFDAPTGDTPDAAPPDAAADAAGPDAAPAECDGPEDCMGQQICCGPGGGQPGAFCTTDMQCTGGLPLCHDGADCASGVCCQQGFCGPGCD
jgi:hypothetical protein